MTRFGALVVIFVKDLVRRRMIWLLVLVSIGVLALNYGVLKVMEEAVGQGATWDIASKEATSRLHEVADTMRGWMSILAVLVAAQLAPESRRNGSSCSPSASTASPSPRRSSSPSCCCCPPASGSSTPGSRSSG